MPPPISNVAPFPDEPQVAICFSKPSLYLDGEYPKALTRAHAEANFLDFPGGFATDRMILAGKLSRYRLLIVPDAEFVDRDVRDAIERFAKGGGRVLLTKKSLRRDPGLVKPLLQQDAPGMKRVDSLDRAALARATRTMLSSANNVSDDAVGDVVSALAKVACKDADASVRLAALRALHVTRNSVSSARRRASHSRWRRRFRSRTQSACVQYFWWWALYRSGTNARSQCAQQDSFGDMGTQPPQPSVKPEHAAPESEYRGEEEAK